jgi:sec-independent protein translocase protein TatB
MFDIGWSEMAVIMLVALVVIGPKDLPRLARTIGQWVAKGRSMAREFQRSLEDMAREAELDEVKREIEKVGRADIKRSLEKAIDPTGDLGKAFDPSSSSTKPAKAAVAAPNGEAKPLGAAKPEASVPAPVAPAPKAAPPEPSASVAPPAEPKPTAAAKPKAAAKPRARAKPKTPAETAPKPAASQTGNGAGPS